MGDLRDFTMEEYLNDEKNGFFLLVSNRIFNII